MEGFSCAQNCKSVTNVRLTLYVRDMRKDELSVVALLMTDKVEWIALIYC